MTNPTRTELVRVPKSAKARVELRQATYRDFVPPDVRCETCVNYFNYFMNRTGNCTIEIRNDSNGRSVSPYAVCDAWEARP
jgi:hypothetical protein